MIQIIWLRSQKLIDINFVKKSHVKWNDCYLILIDIDLEVFENRQIRLHKSVQYCNITVIYCQFSFILLRSFMKQNLNSAQPLNLKILDEVVKIIELKYICKMIKTDCWASWLSLNFVRSNIFRVDAVTRIKLIRF